MPPPSPEKVKFMFTDDIKFLQKSLVVFQEKFLVLKRPDDAHSRPGCWDLPGGNVHYGENHMQSLLTEIKEETGLDVFGMKPIHVASQFKENIYYLFIGYLCKAGTQEVEISEEHTEYRWVTHEEFVKLRSAKYLKEFVEKGF